MIFAQSSGWKNVKYSIIYPVGIYLLKVNNRNSRIRCEISSKLTIIVNFEHVNAYWVQTKHTTK